MQQTDPRLRRAVSEVLRSMGFAPQVEQYTLITREQENAAVGHITAMLRGMGVTTIDERSIRAELFARRYTTNPRIASRPVMATSPTVARTAVVSRSPEEQSLVRGTTTLIPTSTPIRGAGPRSATVSAVSPPMRGGALGSPALTWLDYTIFGLPVKTWLILTGGTFLVYRYAVK